MTENGQHGRCRRCHRSIILRKEGQQYGPKCALKEAASIAALERYGNVVDPQLKRKYTGGFAGELELLPRREDSRGDA